MFPSSIKMIESVCLKCNYSYNHEKRNHYLLITRTPIYMYARTILILGLVASLVNENIRTQKENSEFVNNPKVNDVYLIREDHKKMTSYYFMKIKSMKADTLELLLGSQLYPRFVSTMQISDYFVTDKKYKILKSVLIKKYFDKGMINMVERNYDKSSRFMIEK